MPEYSKENTGVLNKNEKGDNDRRPDYRGFCDINGAEFWIAAWIREGPKGKFMSLKFEAKDANQTGESTKKPTGGTRNDPPPFMRLDGRFE